MQKQYKTAAEWKAVSETNPVATALQQMRIRVGQVLDGERLGTFVFGGAGMGKNHIVAEELRKRKLPVEPISPASVKDLLNEFLNATYDRERGHKRKTALPLVFDEARLIFETQTNMNVLKLALDPGKDAARYHTGHIWFVEEPNGFNEETGEERFKRTRHQGVSLAAPIIALTNKNLHEFDRKVQDHAEALLSRVQPISIPDDTLASWEYVMYLALTQDIVTRHKGRTLPLTMRTAILNWFTANVHNLTSVSIRTLEGIRNDFATSSDRLLDADLALHLRPADKRVHTQPPALDDWAKLRMELTQSTQPA